MLGSYVLEDLGLDARNELHLAWTDFIFQETINIERTLRIDAIDHTQRIERDAMPVQHLCCGEDLVEGRLAVLGYAIVIVQFLGTVNAQANKESVLLKKGAPFVVKQRAVRLEIIFNTLPWLLVLPFELDDLVEKLQPQQGRLTALPGEDHLASVLPLDVLSDMGLKDLVGNAELAAGAEQIFLVQVITVGAVKIADCANWFYHRVVGTRRAGLCRVW